MLSWGCIRLRENTFSLQTMRGIATANEIVTCPPCVIATIQFDVLVVLIPVSFCFLLMHNAAKLHSAAGSVPFRYRPTVDDILTYAADKLSVITYTSFPLHDLFGNKLRCCYGFSTVVAVVAQQEWGAKHYLFEEP